MTSIGLDARCSFTETRLYKMKISPTCIRARTSSKHTSLYEMVTFSWNLDFRVLTPVSGGGNCAATKPAMLPSNRALESMVSSAPLLKLLLFD